MSAKHIKRNNILIVYMNTNIQLKNRDNFLKLFEEYVLKKYRKQIYLHILTNKEESYFDLDKFNYKYVNDMKITHKITKIIRNELELLGWKTDLSFGDTGLFIYSDKKPPNCY